MGRLMGAVIWQEGKAREGKSQDEAQGSIEVGVGRRGGTCSAQCRWASVFTFMGILAIILCISHCMISAIKNISMDAQ